MRSDITFCQEANGCLPELVRTLKQQDPQFSDVCYDPHTHILLRKGHFLPPVASWPQSSFYVRAWTPNLGLCTLVNIHLCEQQWTSACPREHERFRVAPIKRILDAVQHIDAPLIIGGDFNCFSHLDMSFLRTRTHDAYSRVCSLPQDACTSFVLQQRGMIDCGTQNNTDTWPVSTHAIQWSEELQKEIDPCEPSGRITRIYLSHKHFTHRAYHAYANDTWFSDHAAVVVEVKLTGCATQSVICRGEGAQPPSVQPSITLSVSGSHETPRWHMTALELSGEKNHYIELSQRSFAQVDETIGYFYVDGLTHVRAVELQTGSTIHIVQIGTFEPSNPIATNVSTITATLYNESQESIMTVEVCMNELNKKNAALEKKPIQ